MSTKSNEMEKIETENQKQTKCLPMDKYEEFFKSAKLEFDDFTLHKTNYTRKIKFNNLTFVFNNEGESDMKLLSLIGKVRRDALNFIQKNPVPSEQDMCVEFFSLIDRPPTTYITKVDVRGAYWETAKKLGVITEETDQYLKNNFSNTKQMKEARLKALGSLATVKLITRYINGVEEEFSVTKQPTKDLYMYICQCVDKLMRDTAQEINGVFYYYWDCIFADERAEKNVVDYILGRGYSTKTERSRVESLRLFNQDYLVTTTDALMYVVKFEERFRLKSIMPEKDYMDGFVYTNVL